MKPTAVHAAPAAPLNLAATRLWLARALAWSLLMGGWLALGALGRQHLPQVAGGLMPLALWLLAIGLGLAWAGSGRQTVSAPALRCTLLIAATATAGALLGVADEVPGPSAASWLLLAAGGWAALLLAASWAVRALRQRQRQSPPSPVLPAIAGALLAWAWAGDHAALRPSPVILAAALLAAALGLAALLPRALAGLTACRAGLFDCSLPLLTARRWRHLQDWPQAAAALSMLPMMVSLAQMADWCAALPGLGGGAATLSLLHLAAMLGPALVLAMLRTLVPALRWPVRVPVRVPVKRPGQTLALAAGMLLAAGGLALLAWPGLAGLMVASLLHGMAWSLAWAGSLRSTEANPAAAAPPGHARKPAGARKSTTAAWWPAALTTTAVLALGLAIDQHGPAALATVHAALALAGGLGVLGLLAAQGPSPEPLCATSLVGPPGSGEVDPRSGRA